jgi:hypothetical protein
MNETIEQFLIREISKLFTSRNQSPMKGLIEQWMDDLKGYPPESIYTAFEQVRKYGGAFPSLPEIIRIIERKPDAETGALIAWNNVRKAIANRSSSNLTKSEKKTLLCACTGLTEAIEADGFKLGVIERDFKRLFVAMEQGIIEQPAIETHPDVIKIAGDFAKLPFPS